MHSQIVPSGDGLFAALAKPSSGRPRAEIERFQVEQINWIAARFVWVSQAIAYVLKTAIWRSLTRSAHRRRGLELVAVDYALSLANLDLGQ